MARRRVKAAVALALLVLAALVGAAEVVWRRSDERVLDTGGTVEQLVFSADGSRVATITEHGLLRAWTLEGELVIERHFDTETVVRFRISPLLDSVASFGTELVVHAAAPRVVGAVSHTAHDLKLEDGSGISSHDPQDVVYSEDGATILVAGGDGVVAWSTRTDAPVRRVLEPLGAPWIACPVRAQEILALPWEGVPRIVTFSGKLVRELGESKTGGWHAAWSGDGTTCAVSHHHIERFSVDVFRTGDGARILSLEKHFANRLALSEPGDLLAVYSQGEVDGKTGIFVHAVPSGRLLRFLPDVGRCAFAPSRQVFAWAHERDPKLHLIPVDRIGRWRHLRGGS